MSTSEQMTLRPRPQPGAGFSPVLEAFKEAMEFNPEAGAALRVYLKQLAETHAGSQVASFPSNGYFWLLERTPNTKASGPEKGKGITTMTCHGWIPRNDRLGMAEDKWVAGESQVCPQHESQVDDSASLADTEETGILSEATAKPSAQSSLEGFRKALFLSAGALQKVMAPKLSKDHPWGPSRDVASKIEEEWEAEGEQNLRRFVKCLGTAPVLSRASASNTPGTEKGTGSRKWFERIFKPKTSGVGDQSHYNPTLRGRNASSCCRSKRPTSSGVSASRMGSLFCGLRLSKRPSLSSHDGEESQHST